MPDKRRGTWVGIVGPDGAGKTALVDELVAQLQADGVDVVHTHGRPQMIARRTPPPDADPSKPHAREPRGVLLSLAKYLLAAVDFLVARRRLLADHDVWLCERPLVDYEVDPSRYQLARPLLPVVRRLNAVLPGPDHLLVLSGDPQVMADRKAELAPGEIKRQLSVWHQISERVRGRTHRLDTTAGDTAAEVARTAAAAIRSPVPARLAWRVAPVKPTRLDVRMAGSDTSALDVYRPIRFVPTAAATVGRALVRARATPRIATPDPAVDELVAALQADGRPITGVAAMASSAKDRWVVGLAQQQQLTCVAKIGPADDAGLVREAQNLRHVHEDADFSRVRLPQLDEVMPSIGRAVVATAAHPGRLTPVTDIDDAIAAATELAGNGWTHGDLAPWNLFVDDRGRLVLLDWEEAEQSLRPLWDIVHYLTRLGATTHPRQARGAFEELARSGREFSGLLSASGVEPTPAVIHGHVETYLSDTRDAVMSASEGELRAWMAEQITTHNRSSR